MTVFSRCAELSPNLSFIVHEQSYGHHTSFKNPISITFRIKAISQPIQCTYIKSTRSHQDHCKLAMDHNGVANDAEHTGPSVAVASLNELNLAGLQLTACRKHVIRRDLSSHVTSWDLTIISSRSQPFRLARWWICHSNHPPIPPTRRLREPGDLLAAEASTS